MIEKTLTITGPSAGIVIRRRSTDPDFRIFRIDSDVSVRLTNLTIRDGKLDRPGGGIINFGTLALTNCTVAGNSVGGIGNREGTLTVTNSTVAYNTGGGIADIRGRSTLTNARIVGNSTPFEGGGIFVFQGRFTLTNSTVARNSAGDGGGIANFGAVTLTNSTVVGNSATILGGGIFSQAPVRARASVTLTNSTVSGNSARFGGGIFNSDGSLALLTNSTVAFNSATQEGGGIRQGGEENFLRLTNSLVARNSAPTGPDVLTSSSNGVAAFFSLIGGGSGSGITNADGNQVGNVSPNSLPIDPRLGPLADNGGPTRTHALLLGSPAIDAASTPDCPTTDQRWVLRPQGAACDIGSYEHE